MSTNKQAQAIISDIRLKHGSGDEYAPIIRWDEFEVITGALEAAEKRIAELEARTVCLPKLPVLGSNAEWYEGFAAGASGMRNECADAIRAAGIGVKGE